MNKLECIEVEHGKNPDATVIWLHGLGASYDDFAPAVSMLGLPDNLRIRFVFPNAPVRAVAINNGMRMRAWYDIEPVAEGLNSNSGDGRFRSNSDDIAESAQSITDLIKDQQKKGISSPRIILAGFSQGGVISLYLGLGYPEKLNGIIALSTYLHDPDKARERFSSANSGLPIFMAHGLYDPLIPISRAKVTKEVLQSANYHIEWHEYNMEHSACPEEFQDLGKWLTIRLS